MKRKSSDLTEFYIQFLIVVYLLWSFPVLSFGQKEVLVPADGTVSEGEEQPVVALTFDDGPSGTSTPVLLEGLRKRGVRATFFVVGENVEKGENAQILREMSADGHLIGNHTYNHVQLDKISKEAAKEEIETTNQKIFEMQRMNWSERLPGSTRSMPGHLTEKCRKMAMLTDKGFI